jgi:hypothetical protein
MIWVEGQQRGAVPGLLDIQVDMQTVTLNVGSGEYHFMIQMGTANGTVR